MKHSGKLSAKLFLACIIYLLMPNVHAVAQQLSHSPSAPFNTRLTAYQHPVQDISVQSFFNPSKSITSGKYNFESGRLLPGLSISRDYRSLHRFSAPGNYPFTLGLFLLGSLEMSKMHLKGESFTDEEISNLVAYDIGALVMIPVASFKSEKPGGESSNDFDAADRENSRFIPAAHSGAQFSIRVGLKYIVRGVKESSDNFTSKTLINYLNLPIYGVIDFASMSEGHFFAGLGPFIGYALSGKYKDEENGVTTTTSISFGKNGGVKRGDFGIGIIAGYAIQKFIIQVGYDLGLTNLYYDDFDKVYNRSFKLEIGYLLTNLSKK